MTKTLALARGCGEERRFRARGRGPLLAILLSTAASVLPPLASPAYAQSQIAFDIPAGDLGSALAQIGRASGQAISFPAELTRGRTTGPIVGQMSVGEAVARALAGTGLTAVAGSHGSLIIRRAQAAAPAAPAPGGDTLAAIDVADLVGGTGDHGFVAGNTSTSDRLNIPLKENPRSVVGVTKDVIRTQGLTSILDAARNVSNVTVSNGAGQGQGIASYSVRGFDVQNVMIGGRIGPRGINVPIEDVERVDVIKGPTTDLTGVSLPGGGINIIPKVPSAEPIREAAIYLGSRFYRTLAFDLGGPVEGTENLTYRINVSGNTADTAPGGDRSPHDGLISPKVRWDDGETTVTAGVRYADQIVGLSPITVGNYAFNWRPIRVSRERPIGTADAGASFRSLNPYLDFERKLGSVDTDGFGTFDFAVRNRSAYFSNNYTSVGYIFGPSMAAPTVVSPIGNYISVTERKLVTQSDVILTHTLNDYKNTMRFGVDYTTDFMSYLNRLTYPRLRFDARMPPAALPLPSRDGYHAKTYKNFDDIGLAFQDKIDLFDRLHILGSVRQDFYEGRTTYTLTKMVDKADQPALTYNGGAVYDITKWMSVYGTMGTGFTPNQGVLANGQSAPPQFINLSEYGLKFNLLDERLIVTASRFENQYSNVLIYDRSKGGNVLGPGSSSHGLELDVQGQLTDNISLIASVGHTQIRAQGAKPGEVFPGVPPYKGTLFAVYTFTKGPFQGFQFGAGTEAVTWTYSSFGPKLGNSRIPGYATVDAMVGYARENITVSLNVKNLFDHYYYAPTQVPQFIPVGQGRQIMAQARIKF
ncbi:iron complex outermembrane recepter protein [Methylobacterium phyllostachyos]|uniref:Iron complex outermembrane recepter protein n=1 Tax=Methylobacterium phyllostachyos TaxID=582672 RepID=A0A1H0L4A1_9HYPH|nr:TonB-dependent receptor [Methylobacterium phyllostachyos]SDO62801.1 iron complex outermembrane recepter protein [Methylobacterium phyllostachyos]